MCVLCFFHSSEVAEVDGSEKTTRISSKTDVDPNSNNSNNNSNNSNNNSNNNNSNRHGESCSQDFTTTASNESNDESVGDAARGDTDGTAESLHDTVPGGVVTGSSR